MVVSGAVQGGPSDDEAVAAAKKMVGYIVRIIDVLADENDVAVVLATLSSFVSIALKHYGVPVSAFVGALRGDERTPTPMSPPWKRGRS